MMKTLVHAVHLCAWAFCYGALTYTYFRLNAQMHRFVGSDAEYEAFAEATAKGLHRWIASSLALAAITGTALLVWRQHPSASDTWWGLVGAKTALLVTLVALQAHVSWIMWPRRRRALPGQASRDERRFFTVTFIMGFLLLAQLVLGTLAHVPTLDDAL